MVKVCTIGLWILVVVTLACGAAPVIYVEEAVWNFGTVVEGEIVNNAFIIENNGDEPLQILNVWTSCGCTTTSLSGTTIDPGRAVRLGVELSTVGYAGIELSKKVYIESNDPEKSQMVLELVGNVVRADPYLIDAQDLSGGLFLLIDLRDPAAYATGHLLGAVNVPIAEMDIWLDVLPKDTHLVLYDQYGKQSTELAAEMIRVGFSNIHVLVGGFEEWTRRYGERLTVTLPLFLLFVPQG